MPVLTRNGYRRAIEVQEVVLSREEIRRRDFLATVGREVTEIVQGEMIDNIENYQFDMTRRESIESLLRRLLRNNDNIKSARLALPFPRLAYIRLYGEDAMNNFVDDQSFQVSRIQQYIQGDVATRLKVYAEVVAAKLIDRERELHLLSRRIEQTDRIYADKSKLAETLQEIIPRCFCKQPLLIANWHQISKLRFYSVDMRFMMNA